MILTAAGDDWTSTGTELAHVRTGDGFARRTVSMRVIQCGPRYLVPHRDTGLDIDGWDLLPDLERISGWFGYCPLAIRLYQTLGIPVRRTA